MLAQSVMAGAELERFPQLGRTGGDFRQLYKGLYPGYRWQRSVEASGLFPDIRKVEVSVSYGPRFRRSFALTEFLHDPEPQPMPNGGAAGTTNPSGGPSIIPGQAQ
jgi:hypothetical protein